MHLSFLISLGSFATLSVTVITPRTSHTGVWGCGGEWVCACVCVCVSERKKGLESLFWVLQDKTRAV